MRKVIKKVAAVVLALSMMFSSAYVVGRTTEKEVKAADDYQLVWSDEFDGTALDRSNWNVEVNGNGGGNNELQYYKDSTNNIQVNDGTLKIIARKESYGGKSYTSGRINSNNLRTFKYGKLEARMKLPSFAGIWPAFWTLGANYSSVGWPKCGEMDIMEAINENNRVFANLHWSYKNSQADTQNGKSYDVGDRTQWHTYGMEWTEDKASFYVDGYVYQSYDITTAGEMEEFRKNQFIIFNLAVGGNLPGFNIDDSKFPATMEVDWVRVYQKPEEETTAYDGPTITVNHDSIGSYAGNWTSFFGSNAWCNSEGTVTQNGTKASEGAKVNVTAAGKVQADSQWSVQANIENLDYYAGNTYTLKCTLLSDADKKVYIKVAGEDEEELSGEYITLKKDVPFNYVKTVPISSDYKGKVDLKFGLGRSNGDTVGEKYGFNVNISNLSFTTVATIPDPSYVPPTTKPVATTAKPTGNDGVMPTLPATTAKTTTTTNPQTTAKIKNTKIKKVKSYKKKSIKITLQKVKGISGYQIRYSTSKKFKNVKIKNTRNLTTTIKKLKSKKMYYFKARTYLKDKKGKKVYGKYSAVKKTKAK